MPIRINDPRSLEDWIVNTEQRLRSLEARRLDAGDGTQIDHATKQVSAKISDDPGNAASIGEDGGIKATDTVTTAADHNPLYIMKFMTGNTVVANATDTVLSWGGAVTSGTWTHDATTITIPEAGNYVVKFAWQWAPNAAGSRGLKVLLNGTSVAANSIFSNTIPQVGISIECAHGLSDTRDFAAGAVLRASVFQNSGLVGGLGGGAPYNGGIRGQFTVFKIGDAFPPELTQTTE